MKLKYEFLLITSFGFIYLKYIKNINPQIIIKALKRLNKKSSSRTKIKHYIKNNLHINSLKMTILCHYIIQKTIKII
ncbi:MAG TPA: hypothetical protein V7792_00220 [Candidatus Azoamicus sp. OHIO2]